jgi:predicted nucleotidyltransferase
MDVKLFLGRALGRKVCEEAEAMLGRRVDVITEDGLSPYLRDRVLAEAVPL